MGFVPPIEGTVNVLGFSVPTNAMEARSLIGYMPESESFIAGINAVQFVTHMAQLSGLPKTAAIERSHEVLQYVGLGESRYRNLETYSLGMKQRAKLAQAIVHDPSLLLLDEPTNGMDPAGREEMLNLISDLSRNKGMSVILCSHLLKDVETIADEIIVLGNGRVVSRQIQQEQDTSHDKEMYYFIRVKGDKNLFLEVARSKNLKITTTDERPELILSIHQGESNEAIRVLYLSAEQTGCIIQRIEPQKESLEDVFTKAVGDLNHAGI